MRAKIITSRENQNLLHLCVPSPVKLRNQILYTDVDFIIGLK